MVLNAVKKLVGFDKKLYALALSSKTMHCTDEVVEKIYEEAIDWFSSLGFKPQCFSSFGVSGFVEAKKYDFMYADKKLRRRGFKDVTSINLSANQDFIGFILTRGSSHWDSTKIVFYWPKNIAELYFDLFEEMVSSTNNFIEIYYAAAFQIYSSDKFTAEFCLSPFFKIEKNGGTISITPNNVSTKDLSTMGIHESSYLKDVYPYQIVSEAHLSYKIDEISLKDWISQSELNGNLFEFDDNKWIWVIDDKVINQIRERLIENCLLTSYMDLSEEKIKKYGH